MDPIADTEIQIPSAESIDRSQFLTNVIIFSLHYFGCEIENISGVLNAYKLDNSTSDQVAQYIKDGQHIKHHDEGHWHPDDEKVRFIKGEDECVTIVKIKYAHGLPVSVKTACPILPAWIPEYAVMVQAADGRQIMTLILCRKFYCYVVT